jgi:hypothetical protein
MENVDLGTILYVDVDVNVECDSNVDCVIYVDTDISVDCFKKNIPDTKNHEIMIKPRMPMLWFGRNFQHF